MKNKDSMNTPNVEGNDNFAPGEYVVHPEQGMGVVEGVVTMDNADGFFYSINYETKRMRVKVPVTNIANVGLRKLSTDEELDNAMETLKGKARVSRRMWSRRAQEYESKINSGNPVSVAEVLRDLKRSNDDEKSYSERQIYQSALERLAREVAIVNEITEDEATQKLEDIMAGKKAKSARKKTANNNEKEAA